MLSPSTRNQMPAGALAVVLLAFCAQAIAADDSQRLKTMSDSELEAGMKAGVQVVLQRVPIQMENQTVLVGAEYEPNTRIATYHYVQAGTFDPAALRTRFTTKNCTTPNVRAILSRGITFRHQFTAGDRMVDFSVTNGDCRSVS
ncbi:hypothetical protein QTI66_00695 [Variovorax sp. J22R133]|uniref:hypothetical protein n=1 Tax=Variovorax brevis TaxID=3053503 RepID=UPI002576A3B1|nr:hypothetical protein [Variovorax sp. J22R133]MDM0110642.1 hypothetical protein [Variovorax sp. J22R133]